MILNNIYYDYNMKKAKFDSIIYYFKFDEKELESEDFSQLFKNKMALLEEVIETKFFEGKFKIEDEGNITSNSISKGQRYTREYKTNFLQFLKNTTQKDFRESVRLYYETFVYDNKIKDFDLNLLSTSSSQKSIFELYDSIIVIPQLDLSTIALKNISNIKILREGNFNPNMGLELLISK